MAGTGSGGYSGDDGAAGAAQLMEPFGAAVDFAGNIYIADRGNDVIRMVAKSDGKITTVAGNGVQGYSGDHGAATVAQLFSPSGIAVDSEGNIYIADYGNHVIRVVTKSTGIITTVAGTGSDGYSGDHGAATSAELFSPAGVAVDLMGNIYIADYNNDAVRMVTKSTGIITTVAGTGYGGYSGDYAAATAAHLSAPADLAVDSEGNIYIADYHNDVIRMVTSSTGIITTVAGTGSSGRSGDGDIATAAQLSGPSDVAVDSEGNIYIADCDNNMVRMITKSTGKITTVAGNGARGYSGDLGAATAAQLSSPAGVAVDSEGNIYITEILNHAIRMVPSTVSSTSISL